MIERPTQISTFLGMTTRNHTWCYNLLRYVHRPIRTSMLRFFWSYFCAEQPKSAHLNTFYIDWRYVPCTYGPSRTRWHLYSTPKWHLCKQSNSLFVNQITWQFSVLAQPTAEKVFKYSRKVTELIHSWTTRYPRSEYLPETFQVSDHTR